MAAKPHPFLLHRTLTPRAFAALLKNEHEGLAESTPSSTGQGQHLAFSSILKYILQIE